MVECAEADSGPTTCTSQSASGVNSCTVAEAELVSGCASESDGAVETLAVMVAEELSVC